MRALPLTFTLVSTIVLAPFVAAADLAGDELAALGRALDASPDDRAAYEAYATKALGSGKFDEGIAKLKVGVARVSDFANGYYLLGYAYRKKGVFADAAAFYRIAIALKHKELESQFGLGQSLAGLGDKKGAVAALKKYVAQEKRDTAKRFVDEANATIAKLEPGAGGGGDASGLRAEADKLRNEKRFDEAAAAYRRAIEADKANLDLYNDLGNVYFAVKKYNDAAGAFREAVNRDGKYALGWYNLAHALRKADRKAEAVEAYRKYMGLKPEDPDPYYGLGQTLKALGDNAGAMSAFRKYVEMEKRPDEQKWVEKARQELAAMEAMQRPAMPSPGGAGKISDEK
jgi:tetratricopeptide (TPR) repeat protein